MTTIRAFSFGGGVQSTACLVLAAEGRIDFPIFLFANVGEDSENPDTLRYVEEHARPYAERNGIQFHEVRRVMRDGTSPTLYQDLTKESRTINIPVRMANGAPGNRNCTENYKIKVIAKWLRNQGATVEDPAVVGLGISVDEIVRARTDSGIPTHSITYPLIDMRIDRSQCHGIIERAGLPVPPKSSCYFCPYRRLSEWKKMRDDKPELFQKAVDLEATLNARRKVLGKDDVYLSSRAVSLDKAVGTHSQRSLFDEEEGCESGYCMV